jgi:hypothetical protein
MPPQSVSGHRIKAGESASKKVRFVVNTDPLKKDAECPLCDQSKPSRQLETGRYLGPKIKAVLIKTVDMPIGRLSRRKHPNATLSLP